jgi:hypothetical protein
MGHAQRPNGPIPGASIRPWCRVRGSYVIKSSARGRGWAGARPGRGHAALDDIGEVAREDAAGLPRGVCLLARAGRRGVLAVPEGPAEPCDDGRGQGRGPLGGANPTAVVRCGSRTSTSNSATHTVDRPHSWCSMLPLPCMRPANSHANRFSSESSLANSARLPANSPSVVGGSNRCRRLWREVPPAGQAPIDVSPSRPIDAAARSTIRARSACFEAPTAPAARHRPRWVGWSVRV